MGGNRPAARREAGVEIRGCAERLTKEEKGDEDSNDDHDRSK